MEQSLPNIGFMSGQTVQPTASRPGEPPVQLNGSIENEYVADGELPDPVPFPVAIVGMGMRLPGGVNSAEAFWDFLVNKRDGLCKVPESRYNVEAFYDESRPGAIRTKHGHFLQQDIAEVDNAFFGIGKQEAEKLDPQQRLLLEVVWECMESAGQVDWQGTNIGCYVGVFGEDWLDILGKDTIQHDRYRVMSAGDFALSNRVSYVFDLRGPSVTLRTGCSSSMVGLNEACQALYAGDCSSALVAGTGLIMGPTMTTSMSMNLVISTSGICKTFDAAADGYGRGEAINALYIKPLRDALEQGDPIRAIIRSTAVNCDGKTPSITTPGSEAQEQLIRWAYRKARIEGDEIAKTAFFECHGTGTIVGDTAETSVVANIFGQEGIYIGAVKPNVGHSEGASGITSIIKCALALENNIIPPNVHFHNPNPKIPFETAKLKVPVEPTSWPSGKSARVSVNSFGIGGTNAHTILESASSVCRLATIAPDPQPGTKPHLLVVSAKSKLSLEGRIEGITKYLQANPVSVRNLAFTLGRRRVHLPNRAFAVVDQDGRISPFEMSRSTGFHVVFVFTGQGAQWPTMGRDLMVHYVRFRNDIRDLDRVLQSLREPPNWRIEEELSKEDATSRVGDAQFAQPLCTAIQIALVNMLRDWGIFPASVVGHSSGEIAAAYASGAISARLAIILSYFRGQSIKDLAATHRGGMAAVGMTPERVRYYLKDGVTIACENSPESVTLSGDKDVLESILDEFHAHDKDIFYRRLAVNVAYHSHHMRDPGRTYHDQIQPHISHNAIMVPLYSTVTAAVIYNPSQLDAKYWCRNLQSPVLFSPAVLKILEDSAPAKVFLEVGPHSALAGPLRQIFHAQTSAEKIPTYVSTLRRNAGQWESLLSTAGHLFCRGAPIKLSSIIAEGKVLTNIPSYPWQHDARLWSETRVAHDWRLREHPYHELLGCRSIESSSVEPSWRNLLQLDQVTWLSDHRISKDVVFPCAAYVAMVGEAIRQITGSADYSVRNLFMKTALTISPSEVTEIVTSLRPLRLADNVDSVWYEFTISAYQNSTWRKHCVGQVRPGPDKKYEAKPAPVYARPVPSENWYIALEKRGLEYGSHFRGLDHILASPSSREATATICDEDSYYVSQYALHPILIDQSLQLLSVAATNGIPRRMTRLCIPMAIEGLYVGTGRGSMSVAVSCESYGGTLCGNGMVVSEDRVVLNLYKGLFFNIQDTDPGRPKLPMASTLHWAPHIDFVPLKNQLPPTPTDLGLGHRYSRLCILFVVETYYQTRSFLPTTSHLKKWHSWLATQYEHYRTSVSDIFPEAASILTMSHTERKQEIERLDRDLRDEWEYPAFCLCNRILQSIRNILEGGVEPIDLLMEGGTLKSFYEKASVASNWKQFMSLLGHSNPLIRVLEIGAGTGGDTAAALDGLTLKDGNRMYSKYTFTDISPGFLPDAKERFKSYADIEYATLDISRDPIEQGFEAEGYDLVIASNVLHATQNISQSLQHVRQLVAPDGRLLLIELAPQMPLIDLIMGILPGWWLGESDGRIDHPYISVDKWHDRLIDAGFTGVESTLYDNQMPYELTVHMLTSLPPVKPSTNGVVCLFHRATVTEWALKLEKQLILAGYTVRWYNLQQPPPLGSNVISLVELDAPFFHDLSHADFESFKLFVGKMTKSNVLWVTRCSQMQCPDPRYGLTPGVLRTIRHEVTRDFSMIELDKVNDDAVQSVAQVFEKILYQSKLPPMMREHEFALQDGVVHVNRFRWSSLENQISRAPQIHGTRKLDIGAYAILDSLMWTCTGLASVKLGEGEAEVDIKYVGLNFKDMMAAMGFFGNKDELGLEASGIVRRIGTGVKNLSVGDRVMIVDTGLACTRKVVRADRCLSIPDSFPLEDAAVVTCVYATVIYSLIYMGHLQKGQSVLIHSACGGVGLAAIQICQIIGAEIYATVGNEQKTRYLIDVMKIAPDHIFDSRSSSFLAGVMEKTNNRGVDIVLNSLSGELLHASWKCVAPSGKMLELGKRDFVGHGQLEMDVFEANRSFIGVDLLALLDENPGLVREMGEQMIGYFVQGKAHPVRPIRTYDAVDVQQAFRYLQGGQNMGKIVIKMPDNPSDLPVSGMHESAPYFTAEASYLLVGGLGGLGRAVATWMVEKGARNIVFLSRSGTSQPKRHGFIKDLESQGCNVIPVVGSVSKIEDVWRAVSAAPSKIAGVIQMSMVLRDQSMSRMTHEEWLAAVSPKVQGTWNLHRALENTQLDFFVLMSSLAGISGWPGQANYGAANSFLDAFVKYRESKGLVASVIDLGLMEDIGYVSESARTTTLEMARSSSVPMLEEIHLLQALETAMFARRFHGPNQLVVGLGSTNPVSDNDLAVMWTREARSSLWGNILSNAHQTTVTSKADELREYMKSIKRNPGLLDKPDTEQRMTEELGKLIASYTSRSEEMTRDELANITIDSLMTFEIRTWFRRHALIELTLVDVSNAGTAGELSKIALGKMRDALSQDKGEGSEHGFDMTSEDERYEKDVELGTSLQPISERAPDWTLDSEGRVFLTGATGFVGAFLLDELLRLPQVKAVACLIRANSPEAGMNRIVEACTKFAISTNFGPKLLIVPGDITKKYLGLAHHRYEQLAKWTSVIFHFGAYANYTLPYSVHRNANVLGLLEIIRFANTGRLKPIHHCSSISACGIPEALTGLTPEDERPVFESQRITQSIGYTQSKFVSESIAWNAMANGFPIAIYRPGFVLGHSVTGVCKKEDVINRLLSQCIRLGCYPRPPRQLAQFIPVDFVTAAVARISLRNDCLGHAYNVVQPNQKDAVTLADTFDILSEYCPAPLECMTFPQWLERYLKGSDANVKVVGSVVVERLAGYRIWWDDWDHISPYGTENLCRALAEYPEIMRVKPMTELLKVYYDYWMAEA